MTENNSSDFWSQAVPGMLNFGFGMYNRNAAQSEAEEKLRRARGPLYDQSMNAATGVMNQAGAFDPQAHAAERFGAQQALLKPVQDRQLADFMSMLRAKGQLGMGTYNAGLEGGATDAGMLMNPQMAAFFAAQNAQRSKDAYGALGEGQSYLDNLLKRSTGLQTQAGATQRAGLEGQRTLPAKATANRELYKGGAGMLQNILKPGGMAGVKDVGGWIQSLFQPKFEPPVIPFDPGFADNSWDWGSGASNYYGTGEEWSW